MSRTDRRPLGERIEYAVMAYHMIVGENKTIRECVGELNISRSTIHNYIHTYITSPDMVKVLNAKLKEHKLNGRILGGIRGGNTRRIQLISSKEGNAQ